VKPIYLMVLAAGLSTRFGRNKLVELVDGVPIVARVVRAGQAAGLKNTVVVTGHERESVLKALAPLSFEEIHNPDYFQGMSTSIRAGVGYLKDKARAIVISPGDMAFTEARLFEVVLAEFARSPNAIVVATYKGRSGHPILFNESTFEDLMKITEEKRGMKEVVQANRENTTYVETSTPRALLDIDYEEDFARAAKELEREKHPE
jgi:molybdenum cofactor cytidylyltransferase